LETLLPLAHAAKTSQHRRKPLLGFGGIFNLPGVFMPYTFPPLSRTTASFQQAFEALCTPEMHDSEISNFLCPENLTVTQLVAMRNELCIRATSLHSQLAEDTMDLRVPRSELISLAYAYDMYTLSTFEVAKAIDSRANGFDNGIDECDEQTDQPA
jgi:hypothetical protein